MEPQTEQSPKKRIYRQKDENSLSIRKNYTVNSKEIEDFSDVSGAILWGKKKPYVSEKHQGFAIL